MDTNVVRTFLDLVQIDSPTGREEVLALELQRRLGALGVASHIDRVGNVVAYLDGSAAFDCFLLNAHMDTVEPGCGIKPVVDDRGWIRAEGTTILGADNKTAIAAILHALERYVALPVSDRRSLDVVFTVSEESGNIGAHGVDYTALRATKGFISDASGREFGDVIVTSPAYYRFDAILTGKAAHASIPEKAVNVLFPFAALISNLPLGRITPDTLANIGVVRAGDVVNTVPGAITVSGEIRSMSTAELEETRVRFETLFNRVARQHASSVQLEWIRENGALVLDQDDSFFRRALALVKTYNPRPRLIRSWGCSDANVFAEHGITLFDVADGSRGAHTSNECVRSRDLERLTDLFYQFITASGSMLQ